MANESIRIRTTPGVDKNIRLKLDQDFDFLEILSLKISQEDLYQPFCANYGVVVGRVIANKGFGVPNAKISIFIPITNEDKKNELIKDFYPFKTPFGKDKNGIRYNLLLSKQTCTLNTPIGNFPSKEEVLDNEIILEIFEKYYKYTTKTNNAGDFMIFGVPVGQHTLHMDLDMSDIGAASVRPYDLIADGYPEKMFKSKVEFKSATNLDSLPQVKTGNKGIEVIPFWGDSETCEIGITRSDFDTGLEIKPSALFFGSLFTDTGKMSINKGCNPKNDQGEQDNLKTGLGHIDMIRVIDYNQLDWVNNDKITPTELDDFTVEGGDLIDEDGTFAFPIPMNLGHVITDEFGLLVPSPDPSVGIATKGMYRFKMNFIEPNDNPKFRTAHILFPSIGSDFGGTKGVVDTGTLADANGTQDQRFTSDISQYDVTVFPSSRIFMDFHTFEWKQMYTIAHFIKKYKKGGNRFSFLGIKNTDISGETNLFPFTNAIWKFDILYYIIAFFIDVVAFILKLLVILVSFCLQFCVRIDISWSGPTILKVSIGFSFNLIDFCYQICPFSFLGNILPCFSLPCEGAPNDDTYKIPPGCGSWSACNPNGCGGSFGCNCPSSPCTGSPEFKINISGTNTGNNPCLASLEDWKCCVKLNAAESRNVIRRVFNDAWVFGTAYLFQFKYKKKKNGREKFCGPGSDHLRGDNYVSNKCCIDTDSGPTCDKCLVRGPNTTQFKNQFRPYHLSYHNYATTTGNGYTGAHDINDLVYCNALMSTKIVSLGRIEMCEETLEQIELSVQAGQALHQYVQKSSFYTGTFFEDGWDAGFWVNFLKETSYEDPRDVLLYLSHLTNPPCSLRDMFWGSGTIAGYPCHEYELKDNEYFMMKEVSKIHVDIELGGIVNTPTEDEFGGPGFNASNPYGDQINDPPVFGGFLVSKSVGSRFSPCGIAGCIGQPSSNWVEGTPGFPTPTPVLPDQNAANSNSWDQYSSRGTRNNINSRSNIPYYYFGINPGRTAINKLKKDFFVTQQ